MADEGIPVATLPSAPEAYDPRDQNEFRRTVERFMRDADSALQRVISQADADDALISVGLNHLSTATLSNSATADFASLITTTYEEYVFVLTHVIPATDTDVLYFRTSTDNGSTYDSGASDYTWAIQALAAGGSVTAFSAATSTHIALSSTVGSDTNEYGWSGTLHLFRPTEAVYTGVSFQGLYANTAAALTTVDGAGQRLSAADVDAVRFLYSTGNLESGTIRLYGVDKGP